MRVVITGAGGSIGRCLMAGLRAAGHDCVGVDVNVEPDDIDIVDVDIFGDPDAFGAVVDGADAVVHLAAIADETSFSEAMHTHLVLTHLALEAAVAGGAGRFVYASSNHAVGWTPRTRMVAEATRIRPDTFYGVGKAACEALCSLYHDRHGIEVACLRIGSFRERPTSRRELSTWLSHGDMVRLVEACLTTPVLGFATMFGISANTRRWWSLDAAEAIGYRPVDDAEAFAAEIEASPEAPTDAHDDAFVGGPMTRR